MEVSTYVWHGCLRPGCKRRLLRACLYASRKARPSTPPPMTMTLAIKRAKGAPTMSSVHRLHTDTIVVSCGKYVYMKLTDRSD